MGKWYPTLGVTAAKGKPVRFEFKVWCLRSSQGYLFNSIPYVGMDEAYDKEMRLGAGVVLQLHCWMLLKIRRNMKSTSIVSLILTS